ncbi:MAG: hypothetical protein KIT84_19105 [Labilithrix sp.]|nr:hypothetical protein [Labilithrix sp.]MCW5813144.1 hypothetical protein [Labilithrix sp.]
MVEWVTVERARIGAHDFVLARRGDEWVVRVDGRTLMSSRTHQSEIELAARAIARAASPRRVLIGGLGLGFTLRAALDRLPASARVVVAELVPELVAWNRGHLAAVHAGALDDPRVEVVTGDVLDVLASARAAFDVVVLDVDNGPEALSQAENRRLYTDRGVRACRDALAAGGVLGVWSAGPSDAYAARLAKAGFATEVVRVPVHPGSRARHVLFLGTKR